MSFTIEAAVAQLMRGEDLSPEQMDATFRQIMTGGATEAQIGGFLVALAMKGETATEIAAAAKVMRELSAKVSLTTESAVDIVGTGGDSSSIFNVSTAATIVTAAAGVTVAKHGNRSVTSNSGSADLLEAAGVNLALSNTQVEQCINAVGVGFMFAPNHHSAMKYAIGPRKQLKVRTIFNMLGPLTNPAGVNHLLLGVFSRDWLQPFGQALQQLHVRHALVVHSRDGLDEISLADDTFVCELKDGELREYVISPADFGLSSQPLASLKVANATESLAMIMAAFDGEHAAAADMIALNAGAALYAADAVMNIADGVAMAHDVMATGQAREKLANWAAFTSAL